MMRIIAVGKCREKEMRMLISEYQRRLSPLVKSELLEVADEVAPQSLSAAQIVQVKERDGERILKKIRPSDFVILLDLQGVMLSSEALADKIDRIQTYESGDMVFVIGGSLGVSEAVRQRANFRWQLSSLTFPHQLVRVLLYEQIYRAFTILHHLPYHK